MFVKILKASSHIIAEVLTLLFNRSLAEEHFPCIWKTAHIAPIHKKENKETCTNYRPISLLSCVGKVLQKCAITHVFSYLNISHLLTPFQSGFIPGDSSVYQLLSLYDDLCRSLDNGATTQAILSYISKAFHKVWHRSLVGKLEAIGIRGGLLNWRKHYLAGRRLAAVNKGCRSD